MDGSNLKSRPGDRAFTLVTVLIVLALLAVIAVGFLSSMTAERTTANAYANKAKAEQVAQSGADAAMATLRQYLKVFPDSCTMWDPNLTVTDGGAFSEGTSLYFRGSTATPTAVDPATDPDPNLPPSLTTQTVDSRKIYVLPLTSGVIGGVAQPEVSKTSALPVLNATQPDATLQNFVDLNIPRYQGDSQGWIGSPPGSTAGSAVPKPVRVPWVEVKDERGLVNGRYAFWVEDESFKVNVNTADMGSSSPPANTHQRRDNLAQVLPTDPLGLIGPRDIDLMGTLTAAADSSPDLTSTAVVTTRNAMPTALFPEALGYSHTPGIDEDVANRMRFLCTSTSGGLNLSRHGSQRLNINDLFAASTLPTETGKIQTQLDTLVQTLRYHVPNFGQRFLRTSAEDSSAVLNPFYVTGNGTDKTATDYPLIYMYKVATNIHDFIDADVLPTFVSFGGIVRAPGRFSPDVWPDETFWAIGKDSAPYISECGVRCTGEAAGGRYTLNVDYYIEVWNMTTKPVRSSQLGRPVIRVANPTKWVGSNRNPIGNPPSQIPSFALFPDLYPSDGISASDSRNKTLRDFDIAIDKFYKTDGSDPQEIVFPAGCATVITTDAPFNHNNAGTFSNQDFTTTGVGNLQLTAERKPTITDPYAVKHVLRCKWTGSGTSTYSGPLPANCDIIKMQMDDSPGQTDYRTDVLMENENGPIDGLNVDLPINAIAANTIYINYSGGGNQPPVFGGYLRGNWTNISSASTDGYSASATGDPRSNNEQLELNGTTTIPSEASRFKNWDVAPRPAPTVHPYQGNGVIPTLGLPNYLSVHPNRPENPWSDYPPLFGSSPAVTKLSLSDGASLDMSADKAPMVVANAPLTSVAQLGDVYDPARVVVGGSIGSSRGGGRTFKIGQHDDRWDGDETSNSRQWTSWRLLDFLSIADNTTQPRMLDLYAVRQPGVININGVARDNGAALKAALTGLLFQTKAIGGDPALDPGATPLANTPIVQKIVDQMKTRLTTPITSSAGVSTGDHQTGAGPFWERGEMSELPLFGRSPSETYSISPTTPTPVTYATKDLTGIDMSQAVFDRGRQELYRRIAEMITTRGDTYTVYAVGQAIDQKSSTAKKTILSTQRVKLTFRLLPKMATPSTGATAADFHPGTDDSGKTKPFDYSTASGLKSRFAKPDHYDIQIIAASTGI